MAGKRGALLKKRKCLWSKGVSELSGLFGPWLDLGPDFGSPIRRRVFTPGRVFWLFLAQVLSADGSCRESLQKFCCWRSGQGLGRISGNTSGYCQGRKRLGEEWIRRAHTQLLIKIGEHSSGLVWLGRVVKVIDGSCLSMPDTGANQREWPQQKSQKPGCGFPLMRVVVIFSLVSGALLEWVEGDYYTSEMTLFRRLWNTLKQGEVLLGDRGFCGYAVWYLLTGRGVDLVLRKPEKRSKKPRTVERLSKHDRIVEWEKSGSCPDWLSREQWEQIEERMPVRELKLFVSGRGFRTKKLTVVTSLLDPQEYPAQAIADLYRRRWSAELYLREIKVVMGMDVLRCKTPELVRKELAMRGIAYNLVRALMLEAAAKEMAELDRISFKGTVSALRGWAPILAREKPGCPKRYRIYCDLLHYLARDRVPLRPDRREPRAKKRRPKSYQLLTQPRSQFMELQHRGKCRAA